MGFNIGSQGPGTNHLPNDDELKKAQAQERAAAHRALIVVKLTLDSSLGKMPSSVRFPSMWMTTWQIEHAGGKRDADDAGNGDGLSRAKRAADMDREHTCMSYVETRSLLHWTQIVTRNGIHPNTSYDI